MTQQQFHVATAQQKWLETRTTKSKTKSVKKNASTTSTVQLPEMNGFSIFKRKNKSLGVMFHTITSAADHTRHEI